jgi:hypothetical protein
MKVPCRYDMWDTHFALLYCFIVELLPSLCTHVLLRNCTTALIKICLIKWLTIYSCHKLRASKIEREKEALTSVACRRLKHLVQQLPNHPGVMKL